MSHLLDSCRAKLARVDLGFKELEEWLDAFRHNSHRLAHHYDVDAQEIVFSITDCGPPPLELAIVAGEIAHGMHVALDWLAWQLILASGGTPHKPEFPIYLMEKGYRDNGVRKLQGISVAPLAALEALQPFKASSAADAKMHPLWLLHEIDNLDKHCYPTLTAVSGIRVSASAPMQLGGSTVKERNMGGGWRGAMGSASAGITVKTVYEPQEGDELMRLKWGGDTTAQPEPEALLNTVLCFGPDVRDAKGWHVYGTLRHIRKYLEQNIFAKPGLLDFFP